MKRRAFALAAFLLAIVLGLLAAETVLRWRCAHIEAANSLDPGFAKCDAELGWTLTPGWKGKHQHWEYAVSYTINEQGFRTEPVREKEVKGRVVAVVGDSFAFGMGVNDNETFVHLLNRASASRFINCGVPGYSTDQEALLIEREVLRLKPSAIWLMVYLGNDLFDNELGRPLQVTAAKPYFELLGDELVLRNAPAPSPSAAAPTGGPDLATMVLGEGYRMSLRGRLERRSAFFRAISESLLPEPPLPADFEGRTAPGVKLTLRIIERIDRDCRAVGVGFVTVLMAGRSFVERPDSLSARYQEAFRSKLIAGLRNAGVRVIDLASALKEERRSNSDAWFYEKDGHLNPTGSRVAAGILARNNESPDRP